TIGREIPDDINWVLRVDGHTDDIPLSGTGKLKDNWELSSARATSVVRYFISEGVPANRLVAAGFGEFQPLVDEDTKEARSANRRIELKLTER
ncbi:MAG: OmpA family protein, partial [Spirochaetales bacterium]|nr:OmpA family protein [Spirochaetales bacterium]